MIFERLYEKWWYIFQPFLSYSHSPSGNVIFANGYSENDIFLYPYSSYMYFQYLPRRIIVADGCRKTGVVFNHIHIAGMFMEILIAINRHCKNSYNIYLYSSYVPSPGKIMISIVTYMPLLNPI